MASKSSKISTSSLLTGSRGSSTAVINSTAVVKGNVAEDFVTFHLPNGDSYEGFIEVKKKEKTVKAQGEGVYKTAQGDSYSGFWDKDVLVTDVKMQFADGSFYEGDLVKGEYQGTGIYGFPDDTILCDTFGNNSPTGRDLYLIDPSNHRWVASCKGTLAHFKPYNHFYEWACQENDKIQLTGLNKFK